MLDKKNAKKKPFPLIIFGAGGHALSVANVAISAGYEIAFFVDKNKKDSTLVGVKIIGSISELLAPLEFNYSIAVGDNYLREKIFNELNLDRGDLHFPALVHQSSVISHFSKVGSGSVVMPQATIGPNSIVGKFCIVNTQASIDHDCVMSNFSSIAPGAITGGGVIVGCRSAISIGAIVKHGLNIGADSVLGANSYLNKDLAKNCVSYGAPAKVIRGRELGDSYL